jgi:deoxycytidine triphosphate deaminase
MTSPLDDPQFAARFREGPARRQEDAEDRFKQTAKQDPFPLIPTALLNSSDFYNYVAATGMVCPFEEEHLKAASYSIRIGDQVVYFNDSEGFSEILLGDNQPFKVPANSITFIKTKEVFRLPPYIAMRFNLKINNVHRGILLGTGPLVDPGFEGHLLIPLHNLTTNTYYFHEDETFVWAEFTKISPHSGWDNSCEERYAQYSLHNKYVPFPKSKKGVSTWTYLDDASKTPVVSSISGIASELTQFRRNVTWGAISGVAVFVFGVILGYVQPLISIKGDVSAAHERQLAIEGTLSRDQKLFDDLVREVGSLRGQVAGLPARDDQGRISAIEGRIEHIEIQLKQIIESITK